ncbi:MAG: hypothetical protein IT367_03370 [Candidatus Hydrogenedentes bacterium]|nr:hypothetical protein [Candidatus Hydrogenedentota bacterium]
MSRIFEALELNGIEFEDTPERGPAISVVHAQPFAKTPKPFAEKILTLHQRIEATLGNRTGKIVSIAALEPGDQGFTYSFELARFAATHLARRVLLLGTWQSGCSTRVLQNGVARGWEAATFQNAPISEYVHQLDEPPIAVSQLNVTRDALAALASSTRFGNALRRMRKQYDLIVVDTPPISEGMDAVLLSPVVDGTVLIVNAGESRWQVVRNAVEQLTAQNGTVVGVVLNKRRYFIPSFIYRKL